MHGARILILEQTNNDHVPRVLVSATRDEE